MLDGAACPVPASVTVCGLPVAPSATEIVPVRAPIADGVKLTLIVQLAPAFTDVPQLLIWLKSPVVETLTIDSGSEPMLLR